MVIVPHQNRVTLKKTNLLRTDLNDFKTAVMS